MDFTTWNVDEILNGGLPKKSEQNLRRDGACFLILLLTKQGDVFAVIQGSLTSDVKDMTRPAVCGHGFRYHLQMQSCVWCQAANCLPTFDELDEIF